MDEEGYEIFELNNDCEDVSYCLCSSLCNYCDCCSFCYACNFCFACHSCNSCLYSRGLRLSERMIFCLGNEKDGRKDEGYQKRYRVFNKNVSVSEYTKVLNTISKIKIYDGTEIFAFGFEDAWISFWKTATKEEKETILNISQFDKKVFKGITGIEI